MSNCERILIVADDAGDFQAAKTAFSSLPAGWQVHFSQSEKDALCYLDQCEFDVIFVDLSAGPFAGAQFLHEVWKKHPRTVRYLLVESMDTDMIVTCVLGAHQFVPKPLTQSSIATALNRVQTLNRMVRVPHVQTLVSRIRSFPGRPAIYLQVMRELRSKNASAQVVGELVAQDLSISTKLIQIVNSAYYGMAQEIYDPTEAVLLIGMQTTASLVLSIEAFAHFDKVKPRYNLTDRVWRHCQSVAQSAKRISEVVTTDPTIANEAYTAGLLHDIGKLALAMNFEEEYQAILNLAQSRRLPLWKVEGDVLGANHAEVGGYMLATWGMPFAMIEAVAGHHLPAQSLGSKFSALTAVHMANGLIKAEHPGRSGFPEAELDLDYSLDSGLCDQMDVFREIVSGANSPYSEETKMLMRQDATSAQPKLPSGDTTHFYAAHNPPPAEPPPSLVGRMFGSGWLKLMS